MHKLIGRIAAAGAALLAIPALGFATAQPASAQADSHNQTVTKGAYKAVFHHTGSKGETLEVFDNATDGDAAVVYVKFYSQVPEHKPWGKAKDTDRFVVTNGYASFNLRKYDSGKYDVPEYDGVEIMVCRGYPSIPGDNCSEEEFGIA